MPPSRLPVTASRCWRGWADELVGVASYEPAGPGGQRRRSPSRCADEAHATGTAWRPCCLSTWCSLARRRGLTAASPRRTLGRELRRCSACSRTPGCSRCGAGLVEGVAELTFRLPSGSAAGAALDRYLTSVAGRESRADVASLRQPAGGRNQWRRRGARTSGAGITAGRAILDNVISRWLAGVDLRGRTRTPGTVEGVPVVASVADAARAGWTWGSSRGVRSPRRLPSPTRAASAGVDALVVLARPADPVAGRRSAGHLPSVTACGSSVPGSLGIGRARPSG